MFRIYTWKYNFPAHLVFFCSFPVGPVLGFSRLCQMIIALSFMLLFYLCLALHLTQRRCSLLHKKHNVHWSGGLIHTFGRECKLPLHCWDLSAVTKCLELIKCSCSFYVNFLGERADKKAIFLTHTGVLALKAWRSREVVHGQSKESSHLQYTLYFSLPKSLCSEGASLHTGW